MLITAKFNGWCGKCGKPTVKGSEIEYENKKAFHPACIGEGDIDEADQLALADRLGFENYDWDRILRSLPPADHSGAAGRQKCGPRRDDGAIWPMSAGFEIEGND